jgi:anaerobic nitric oxide reductase transcription regulator
LGLRALCLAPAAQRALLRYDWPGNVRELEHLIGRAALRALAANPARPRILTLEAEHLGLDTPSTPPAQADVDNPARLPPTRPGPLRPAVEDFQRQMIRASLQRHQHNHAAAARELGLDRANLNRLMRRLGLAM